jgi:hypothetical protein
MSLRFLPYTSRHQYHNGHHICIFGKDRIIPGVSPYRFVTHNDTLSTLEKIPSDPETYYSKYGDRFYHAAFYYVGDYAELMKSMVTDLSASFWEILNIRPVLTITQLMCLKIDDVDGHVNHLEKMLMQLTEENNLLQRRMEALEQKGILYELD